MPVAQRKVIEIMMEEVARLQPRCEGYRELLTDTITDIMTAEREHTVRGTRIQQQVTEKCRASGELLNRQRRATR